MVVVTLMWALTKSISAFSYERETRTMKMFSKVAVTVAISALSAVGVSAPALAAPTVLAPFDFSAESGDPDSNYVAVSSDGALVAVVPEDGCVVMIVTVADSSFRTIDLDCGNSDEHGHPVFSPDGSTLYVPNYTSDSVEVYNLSNDTNTRDIPGMVRAWATAISPDGSTLYVHDYSSGDLFKVALGTDTVTGPLSMPNGTYVNSMCLSADGATLYVPDYDSNLNVVDTAAWTVGTPIVIGDGLYPYGCEMDNDGNLIVNAYEYNQVAKVTMPAGTVTLSAEDMVEGSLYSVVPSCDAIYLGDGGLSPIGIANLSTLALETETVVPTDSASGDGWYAFYGGDRSADGSVIAMGGTYGTDALTIIKSDCNPTLPDTGVDSTVAVATSALALVALAAGAFIVIARRRTV
jgi:LPXTG-motif cell wall-anchored protein